MSQRARQYSISPLPPWAAAIMTMPSSLMSRMASWMSFVSRTSATSGSTGHFFFALKPSMVCLLSLHLSALPLQTALMVNWVDTPVNGVPDVRRIRMPPKAAGLFTAPTEFHVFPPFPQPWLRFFRFSGNAASWSFPRRWGRMVERLR